MKLKSVLIGSAAAAVLTMGLPAAPFGTWNFGSAAHAASVSISINTFYSGLAPYGDWVRYRDRYVFVPVDVPDGWRPYTVGHWTYTKRYGWFWVSAEPFGWATYHYGRWGYSNDIGWYWVPGTKWAPAWVSWRRSPDYVAWAPLPPPRDGNVIVDVSYGEVPDYYWTPVPAQSFLEINLSVVIINDNRERERIVRDSRHVGDVRIENNIVINNVIDVDFIEQKTRKEVKVVEVKESDKPELADKTDGNTLTVFQGDVQAEPDAKPAKTVDVDAVKEVQGKRKNKPTESVVETGGEGQSTEKPATSDQPGASSDQPQTEQSGTDTPKASKEPAAEQQPGDDTSGQDKKKKQTTEQPAAEEPTTAAPSEVEQKPQPAEEPAAADKAPKEEKAKKEPAQTEQAPAASEESGTAAEEKQGKGGKSGKKEKCDPATDPNCAAEPQ
jgi:hypothetical protein